MKRTIIFLVLAIFAVAMHAQRSSFFDKFMQLRESQGHRVAEFQKLSRVEIEKMLTLPNPEFETEEELQRFLRERAMFEENVELIGFVTDEGFSISQFLDLLYPYEELISVRVDTDLRLSLYGTVEENKVTELIVFVGDNNKIVFVNILFREPFDIQTLAENPENISELISINGTEEEQRNAIFSFNFRRSSNISIPGYNTEPPPGFNTEPFTLEIVQVDGKYIVQTVEEEMRHISHHRLRKSDVKPIILGSNPGNTYVMIFRDIDNDIILLDRYGFTLFWGEQMTPVNVLGCEEEIAAFIIWNSGFGYSLFECPEVYALVQRGSLETRDLRWTPPRELRIENAQSIVVTEDGYFRVVKEDGVVEYIPIRRQATNQ